MSRRPMCVIKRETVILAVVSLLCWFSNGCTRRDDEQAKRKLREAQQELKHDASEAGQKLKQGAREAAQEVRKDAAAASREIKKDVNSK
jgi:hypothetical protein